MLPRVSLPEVAPGSLTQLFAPPKSRAWLEIGFGGGEHLVWQARANVDVGLIGCEVFEDGVVKVLSVIDEAKLGNVLLSTEDAREVLRRLPAASLDRVFILFPDPWPKTRHHKRRFVQMEMLDSLARIMCKGAEFRFATDDAGYRLWTLERLSAHPAFAWLARSPEEWRARPADWPQTRYEAKAIAAGRACTYLRFVRR